MVEQSLVRAGLEVNGTAGQAGGRPRCRGPQVSPLGAPGKRRRGGGVTSSHDEHQESQPGGPGVKEPDVRFTLANERTFLAWNRTALALVGARSEEHTSELQS